MTAASRHDLIFAHAGNARVAATVIMAGMLAVLIGGAYMAIGPELRQEPQAASNGGATSLAPVRVIGTAPRAEMACDQQVWPNLEQRCLTRTQAADMTPAAPQTNAKVASTPAQDDDKLSPLTVTPVEHQSALKDDATSGSGVQEDTAVLRSSDTIGVTEPQADATVGAGHDELDELPPPPPPQKPRSRGHRHTGFPFHLRIGAFHF
jgi:hypothetical protein